MIVAVSGGPDSTALVHVLASLKDKYDWKVRVAHVNYGLRGKESEADEAFVRTLAKRYALPCSIKKVRVMKGRTNLEARMRDIRYHFFEQVRVKYGFDTIVTAHTADDQVETALLHLLRGTGLKGLGGMLPHNGALIRPFLNESRTAVLAYLKAEKFGYRVDKSNQNTRFTRNRIRHRLIPYLEGHFNPAFRTLLARNARLWAMEAQLIEESVRQAWKRQVEESSTGLRLNLRRFQRESPALQTTLLHRMLAYRGQPGETWGQSHVEEVLKMCQSTKQKHHVVLFKGLKIERQGDIVLMFYD